MQVISDTRDILFFATLSREIIINQVAMSTAVFGNYVT